MKLPKMVSCGPPYCQKWAMVSLGVACRNPCFQNYGKQFSGFEIFSRSCGSMKYHWASLDVGNYPENSWFCFLFFLFLDPQGNSALHLFLIGPWSSLSFTNLSNVKNDKTKPLNYNRFYSIWNSLERVQLSNFKTLHVHNTSK